MTTATKTTGFNTRKEYEAYCREQNQAFIHFCRDNGAMLEIMYLREPVPIHVRLRPDFKGRGKPFAVIVAMENGVGMLRYGWAMATGKREPFNKRIGLWKALCRVERDPFILGDVPSSIRKEFRRFMQNSVLRLNELNNERNKPHEE